MYIEKGVLAKILIKDKKRLLFIPFGEKRFPLTHYQEYCVLPL